MDIQTLTRRFAYKIEPSPNGGFIARASDPTAPTLEAPTREELQGKIRESVATALAQAFPGLKIPLETKNAKLEFHIERKPEGGFTVHSTELGTPTMQPATHEKVDHLAEQLLGFVDKHFPEFSHALAAQATSDEVQIFTETKVETSKAHVPLSVQDLLPKPPMKADSNKSVVVNWTGKIMADASSDSLGGAITNAPITPQTSNGWTILRFLLGALIIAVVMYFFLLHR